MFTPDRDRTYILAISGGKDSTALWIYITKVLKLPNVVVEFADTGWEDPITYEYLEYLRGKLGDFHTVKGEHDFVELAIKKKRFPSTKARFCTEALKMKPCRSWLLKMMGDGKITHNPIMCSGIRAEESPSRAKMPEYEETDSYYHLPQWRPILDWTAKQVFDLHAEYGIEPNPLYKMGMARVGCMPCIMANQKELRDIAIRLPHVRDKLKEAVKRLAESYPERPSTFFVPGFIPERFCSIEWKHPDTGEMYKLPSVDDVFDYVTMSKEEKNLGEKMELLFDEEPEPSCSSIYNLCE